MTFNQRKVIEARNLACLSSTHYCDFSGRNISFGSNEGIVCKWRSEQPKPIQKKAKLYVFSTREMNSRIQTLFIFKKSNIFLQMEFLHFWIWILLAPPQFNLRLWRSSHDLMPCSPTIPERIAAVVLAVSEIYGRRAVEFFRFFSIT